jgi:acyl-CoA hydrolase
MSASLQLSSPGRTLEHLRPGAAVFVPGVSGESLAFFAALGRAPERAAGVTFVGVQFPGVNECNYLGLHPTSRQRAYFMSPSVRAGLREGRVDLMPLDYPGIVRDLESFPAMDVVVAQVSPPDEHGLCGLGVSQDFLPSVWQRAQLRVAHVNPRIPRTRGSFAIRYADCHLAFESDTALPTLADDPPDALTQRHAALIAGLIDDGDTLQFGVGRLQAAVLRALAGHRRLRIHSGMVSTPVAALIESGVIDGSGAIETGVALGTEAFYRSIDANPAYHFSPVSMTHDIRRIAAIPSFCAINSAVEVDLFGQVNADSLAGRLVAGVGGLPVFAAGARLSPGGRSIVMLPATADKGRSSRIVGAARQSFAVALPRHAADIVVTEYGVAHLSGLSLTARARALVAIAAPEFRDALAAEWQAVEGRL